MNFIKTTIAFVLILLITACSTAPQEPTQDVASIQTAAMQTALDSLITPTSFPQPTELPTQTQDPVQTGEGKQGKHFAWNYVGSQDNGGVVITIARLVLADKSILTDQNFAALPIFDDKLVVGELIFIVENKTDKVISVYPEQGTVIAGSEQVALREYMFGATFGEDFSGEIFPGVKAIGGIWYGLRRTMVDEIISLVVSISGPIDAEFNRLGPDYNFTIDLTDRKDEPIPPELQ